MNQNLMKSFKSGVLVQKRNFADTTMIACGARSSEKDRYLMRIYSFNIKNGQICVFKFTSEKKQKKDIIHQTTTSFIHSLFSFSTRNRQIYAEKLNIFFPVWLTNLNNKQRPKSRKLIHGCDVNGFEMSVCSQKWTVINVYSQFVILTY